MISKGMVSWEILLSSSVTNHGTGYTSHTPERTFGPPVTNTNHDMHVSLRDSRITTMTVQLKGQISDQMHTTGERITEWARERVTCW
jgi:hypothetical protein